MDPASVTVSPSLSPNIRADAVEVEEGHSGHGEEEGQAKDVSIERDGPLEILGGHHDLPDPTEPERVIVNAITHDASFR